MMSNNLLDIILKHSFDTVPFYIEQKNNLANDFNALPIITKDMVSLRPFDFVSSLYIKRFEQGKLINKKTSGSTGMCLDVFWTPNDDTLASLETWKYRRAWYGVSIKDRYITFHATAYYSNRLVEEDSLAIYRGNNLSLSKNRLTKHNIDEYFVLIGKFNASWMFMQPSVLPLLLKYASTKHLSILNKLRYIELTGEYLATDVANYFKEMLPNVKFANMYGTTETGCVALECPCGHMHILKNSKVEILDEDCNHINQAEGGIILTTLKNFAMPLLRYRIGDMGYITNVSRCNCGFVGQDIHITVGREGDIIYSPDGNDKTCYSLLKVVEFVNDEFNAPITQFNFVQSNPASLLMYLNIKQTYVRWKSTIESALYEQLKKEFPAFETIKIIFDGEYDFVENNKVKFFERKFDKEKVVYE